MAEAHFFLADERGVLAVSGPDRKAFLQGLITNDVEKIAPQRAIHAALLTPQGRYLHDFFMVEDGETLLIDCERARLPELQKKLSMFKLRSKVTLEDQSDRWAVAVIWGDGAREVRRTGAERTDERDHRPGEQERAQPPAEVFGRCQIGDVEG